MSCLVSFLLCATVSITATFGLGGWEDEATLQWMRQKGAVPATFDCPMRQLALEFSQNIQPFLTGDQLQEIADALNGAIEAQNCNVSVAALPPKNQAMIPSQHRVPPRWADLDERLLYYNQNADDDLIFVDFVKGSDANDGAMHSPLKLLETAVSEARRRRSLTKTSQKKEKKMTIILRAGRHYIPRTIHLTPEDSHLVITNFNGEDADVSAAIPLDCAWKLYKNGANGKNYYSCAITNTAITDIYGLRVNGVRAIRARFPNANPELDGMGTTLMAKSWMPSVLPAKPTTQVYPATPLRDDTVSGYFQHYNLGIGGCCQNFQPQGGYWCSGETQGGGAFTYKITSGMTYTAAILPHAPYNDTSRMVLQTWRPGHWSSWMFAVGDYDGAAMNMKFKAGGFQGARGNNNGDEFYVENILEELDMPGEYFYAPATKQLLYYNNVSNADPSSLTFEVTNLKVLVNHTGTQANPVNNVDIRGLTFRDTQYTYLDPHGMPSGGDWGLQRQGALYFEGTENVNVQQNLFTRLDGNAISINRYNRNLRVFRNEIVWNGDSAITSWGDTENITFSDDPTTMGYDGTKGNQPRFNNIQQNFVHEIGIWEKQSSLYFQAKSCSNVLDRNIFFNGPRAGINFNDGFGGNSTLVKNLLFNTCRESSDHGPFNSWDRQVYVTAVANGTPSTIKAYDELKQNFFLANYHSQESVDNDDGSCYYKTHDNFFSYSGNGMKNDFGGHDNHHYNNIYGYLGSHCFGINSQLVGHIDAFYNNTCLINQAAPATYGSFDCKFTSATYPKLGNNIIHTNGGDATKTGLCNMNEAAFQKAHPGVDDGTVILGPADDTAVLAQAKAMLFA